MISADRALAGRRILVTRAPHQASELADRLRALDAEPILIPTIEIARPQSYASLDAALLQLASFDVVAFTSANAVSSFAERVRHLGIGPAPKRIAAVGPSTAKALETFSLRADIIPPVYTAESLGETLRPEASGRNVLLVLAEDAPHILHDSLSSAGARVTVVAAYSNRIPAASLGAIRELFGNELHWPEAITFTSASTARNLTALLESARMALPHSIVRASIGPLTTRALAELDLPPQIEAREATIASLVDALAAHFSAHG
jgi:uroporphyrinogen-III synthase